VVNAVRSSGLAILRRVLREQRPCWRSFAGILLAGFAGAPLSLVPPLVVKLVVDHYLGTQPLPASLAAVLPGWLRETPGGSLALAALLLLLAAVLLALLNAARDLLMISAREKLVLGFRVRLFQHVERLSLSHHDREGAAASAFRVLLDTATIPAVLLDGLLPLVSSAVLLVMLATAVAMLSWQLALAALLLAPLLLLLAWPFAARLRRQWHDIKALDSAALSLLTEVFGAMRVVKAFGREQAETDRLLALARQGMDARIGATRLQTTFDGVVKIGTAFGTAVVLVLGAWQVKDGSLTLGGLSMAAVLLLQLHSPLHVIVGQAASLQSSLASAERALALLDEAPEITERKDARSLDRARGAVEFRSVTFGYQGKAPVLKEIAFQVSPGERIGIAGSTGAGKTTLINLLTRLYDPDQGAILLDGVDVRDVKLADLRRQFAVVLQEPMLFQGTVAQNINYARPEAGREETIAAARSANAHDFIAALPQGYDTVLGERGMQLSGGERQRLALARAFLKDAPILILDEPTSSVDLRTEQAILEALARLIAGRTTFLIAHRPSTLAECDRILLLDRGRIAASARRGGVASLDRFLLAAGGGAPAAEGA
jgi:ATP-binding cassette subfamily B protein